MCFVYILQSQLDQSFYIGFTTNIEDRLNEHNFGNTGYSKRKRPWNLVYFESYNTKEEAIKREKSLKRMKSKKYILELINNFSEGS